MSGSGSTGKTHRAVIIGLGFIGAGDAVSGQAIGGQQVIHLDGTHIESLSRHPRVKVVAGSSRDTGRRERFAAAHGIKTYTDWREMLAREKPEIVSVATYAPQHAEMTIAAAEGGARVVYCEKPMATSVAEARQMAEACARTKALLVINHNRRFNPNYRRLREMVAAGGLGQLTSATLQWASGRIGGVGTHLIDALMAATGRQVEAVCGQLDLAGKPDCRGPAFHDPGAWGLLRLEGGLIATVDAADYAKTPARLQINGTLGRATTGADDVSIEFWDGRKDQWPSVRAEATSMDRAVREMVAWLETGVEFPYPVAGAVRTLEAIAAFHVSHERGGGWVSLPLEAGQIGRPLGCA